MSSYNITLLMLGIDLFLDSNTQLCCDKRVYKCPMVAKPEVNGGLEVFRERWSLAGPPSHLATIPSV